MASYHHILVALDYSQDDSRIASQSKTLAQFYAARLSFIHVLDNIPMPDTSYGTRIQLHEQSQYPLLEQEKQHFVEHLHDLNLDPNQCWLIWGNPPDEITNFAREENVDLIVMGIRHKSALVRWINSTSDGVLHHSSCDILAMHLD